MQIVNCDEALGAQNYFKALRTASELEYEKRTLEDLIPPPIKELINSCIMRVHLKISHLFNYSASTNLPVVEDFFKSVADESVFFAVISDCSSSSSSSDSLENESNKKSAKKTLLDPITKNEIVLQLTKFSSIRIENNKSIQQAIMQEYDSSSSDISPNSKPPGATNASLGLSKYPITYFKSKQNNINLNNNEIFTQNLHAELVMLFHCIPPETKGKIGYLIDEQHSSKVFLRNNAPVKTFFYCKVGDLRTCLFVVFPKSLKDSRDGNVLAFLERMQFVFLNHP